MLRDVLTDLAVQNLKPDPAGRFEVFDSKLSGFGVRVFFRAVSSPSFFSTDTKAD